MTLTETRLPASPPAIAPTSPDSAPAIQTHNLVKQYRNVTALAGLTMTVGRGEIFGFLGPNGAGKTTAVKLLLGLARPTSGDAQVLGQPAGDQETRRRIGYLPELFRYQDWLTAREVLQLHCELAGIPRAERPAEIGHALEVVGLAGRAGDRVRGFSKGMQQRLGLGVALLGRPDLIFLDEPTSALDPVGRRDVREIIRLLKGRGTAVFLNSHLLSEVEQVCDRVAIIDKGRVVAEGGLTDVIGGTQAVHLRVADLPPAGYAVLERFGQVQPKDGLGDRLNGLNSLHSLTVSGIDPDAIPLLVAEIVRLGGRVYAVEPRHHSLEERFLQLLREPADANSNHRPPDAA